MPWKETHVMEERLKFIGAYLEGDWSMTELCWAFGVSRQTGYALIARYTDLGLDGLSDSSRAAHRHPNQTPAEVAKMLLAARRAHPRWGPRKLIGWLERRHPGGKWPVRSTVGALLKRHGLVHPRRRVRRTPPHPGPLGELAGPNDVWCADFKGWFRTGDGQRCDPLTITDGFSRFLIGCQTVRRQDWAHAYPVFHKAFREYGLPRAIRTDNGSPFATRGAGGLSRLAIWWIKLGIVPERIEPGQPQQNGRHERMHQTLKQETARPPRATRRAQQRAFGKFQLEYNCERPHEALGNATPAQFYQPSQRRYPRPLRVEYPPHYEVRQVRTSGEIKWRGQLHFLGQALCGEPVGLEQVDDRYWRIYFGPTPLATMDDQRRRLLRYSAVPNRRKHGS
jgi:transposase InsO family protein